MRYSSGPLTKYEFACIVTAALSYLVLNQHDSIGLATFDDRLRTCLKPSSRPSSLKEIVRALDAGIGSEKTNLGPILHEFAERSHRRGLMLVVSDFFDDVPSLLSGLDHLRHHGHEVTLFHVLDGAELDFPFQEPTLFRGLEQLPELFADPLALRRGYLAQMEGFTSALRDGCRQSNMDYVPLRTDASLAKALSSFLARRAKRKSG
jgi:uncharacterized protein (DUF58 family)